MADIIERTYNVPLRREYLKTPLYKRSKKAVKALREFIIKHMKSENVKISKDVNDLVWKHGIKNPPHHISVDVVKDKEGLVNVYLEGQKPAVKADKKAAKKAKAKSEKKDEAKVVKKAEIKTEETNAKPKEAEVKKDAPNVEAKEEKKTVDEKPEVKKEAKSADKKEEVKPVEKKEVKPEVKKEA